MLRELVDIKMDRLSLALDGGLVACTVEVDTNERDLSMEDVLKYVKEAEEMGYSAHYREHPELKGLYHIRLERINQNA